jgi:predicted nucleic acid-binding Zn ribbon protein
MTIHESRGCLWQRERAATVNFRLLVVLGWVALMVWLVVR